MASSGTNDYNGLILPAEPQYERRASGYIIMDDGNGPIETACTIQCCHGGEHFISIKGSGKIRSFCLKCGGVTCGRPEHLEHYDWRKKIEDYEKGKLLTLGYS